MKLVPLVKVKDIRSAFETLRGRMTRGTNPYQRTLGYRGGSELATVNWRPQERIWAHYNPSSIPNRYWCCYGVEDPSGRELLEITAEINPPREGVDRRIRGAFVRDLNGRVYLVHSGGVGGGRKGIGKGAFAKFYRGADWRSVSWPDGIDSE